MTDLNENLREISGLSEIAGHYQGLICDLWGVVHNGVSLYPGVLDALDTARRAGLGVVFLSNAPRPHTVVIDQLARFGIHPPSFRAVVTSGDATRAILARTKPGIKLWHLGPERDRGLIDGLDVVPTSLEEAEAILCTGLFDDTIETPDDYAARLEVAANRDLLMYCANPDLIVIRGTKPIYCAGALAERYSTMGGRVELIGKPFPTVFEMALSALGIDRRAALMIGDGLRTDICGAATAGIDAWLIAGGIHGQELGISDQVSPLDLGLIAQASHHEGGKPRYVSRRFTP
jgi:HAD superfamily hydrolase (TIGR01459 family)